MRCTFRLLGHHQWAQLAQASGADEVVVFDLTHTRVVYPAGVVALALITHARAQRDSPTRIVPPNSDDVLTYLGRIDFFEQIHSSASVDGDISALDHHRRRPSRRFTELIAARDQGFDDVAEVVWKHLSDRSLEEARSIFPVFEELLTNIAEHSQPGSERPAHCFVHVQTYAQEVDLAFGDLGVGYLVTLQQNPELPPLADEMEALRGVLLHGYSRLGHQEDDRGGGLRHIHELVERLEGRMKLLSTNGLARTSPGDEQPSWQRDSDGGVRSSQLAAPFPGTMAWIQLPRTVTAGRS